MTPIATRTDGAAITLLVTFNEPVSTVAGHIDPSPEGVPIDPEAEAKQLFNAEIPRHA